MTTREYNKGPDAVRMITRFGPIRVKAVGRDVLFFGFEREEAPVVVRGAPLQFSAHYRRIDGIWDCDSGGRGGHGGKINASRWDRYEKATDAANAALTQEMAEVAARFAQERPDLLREAEAASISNVIMQQEVEIASLEKRLREIHDEREINLRRERAIDRGQASEEETALPSPR